MVVQLGVGLFFRFYSPFFSCPFFPFLPHGIDFLHFEFISLRRVDPSVLGTFFVRTLSFLLCFDPLFLPSDCNDFFRRAPSILLNLNICYNNLWSLAFFFHFGQVFFHYLSLPRCRCLPTCNGLKFLDKWLLVIWQDPSAATPSQTQVSSPYPSCYDHYNIETHQKLAIS